MDKFEISLYFYSGICFTSLSNQIFKRVYSEKIQFTIHFSNSSLKKLLADLFRTNRIFLNF